MRLDPKHSPITYTLAPAALAGLGAMIDPTAESCGFILSAKPGEIADIWPTPNNWQERPGGRESHEAYSIGAAAWRAARFRARARGFEVIGAAHSHLSTDEDSHMPSDFDVKFFGDVTGQSVAAVWHWSTGRLTLFNAAGAFQAFRFEPHPVMRALARYNEGAEFRTGAAAAPLPPVDGSIPLSDGMIEGALEFLQIAAPMTEDQVFRKRIFVEAGIDPRSTEHHWTPDRLASLRDALKAEGVEI